MCRHLAHRYNALNLDEWLMEMALTQPGARKIPPVGWKPQEFPKEMSPEAIKDLFWFMHEMDQKEVALKEKSDYITNCLDYNVVVKMSSKDREQYLVKKPHVNIFNYRKDLLASACSWLIGVLGLHVGAAEGDSVPVEHRAMPEYWNEKDYSMMHWTKEAWDGSDTKIQKYDLSSGYAWQGASFLLEPYLSSQWVWFNKAIKAKDAEFLVYEDWVDKQEEVFPDSPVLSTIRTPVPYTEMLTENTIELIDEKLKDMKGAFKDNGLL